MLLGLVWVWVCGSSEAATEKLGKKDTALLSAVERAEDLRLAADPALTQALASPLPALRERAVLALGRLQAAEHREVLLRLAIQDPSREVRMAALFAVGQLGLAEGAKPTDEEFQPVFSLLSSPDGEIKALAVEALGKLATSQSAEHLMGLFADPSPKIRAEAAVALFRLSFVPPWRRQVDQAPPMPGKPRLMVIDAFADADASVRRAAVYAFSRFGEPEAAEALLPMLADADELTRLFAARALGKTGKKGAARALSARQAEPSAAVRTELAVALGALEGAELVPTTWLSDPSFHVRVAVARTLAAGTEEASLASLRPLAADPSPTVRAAAIEGLAKRLGPAHKSDLSQVLNAPAWTDRVAAVRGAALLGAAGLELLAKAFEDADRRVATATVEGLAALEGPVVEALLVRALTAPDFAVRGSAVAAVAKRDTMPRGRLLETAYDASAGEDWIEVREAIADALPELPGGLGLLQRIVGRDPAPSVRSRAAAGLAKKGITVALPPAAASRPSPHLGTTFKRNPTVVLETSKGKLEIECFANEARLHCANFVALVKEGYYNGLIWHRVVSNFVVQGGDPRGDGWGGPGYTVRDEISRRRYEAGSVGMPKGGKDTGGGQLFITHLPTPHLDGNYTLFGKVTQGLEVVAKLEIGDKIVKASVRW